MGRPRKGGHVHLPRTLPVGAAAIAALALAACGGGSDASGAAAGSTSAGKPVTIYSSQPLQGATHGQAVAVINGEKLALAQHDGKGGACPVRYVARDDSTAAAGQWDPGAVAENARRASLDPSAIAYLGEFNSSATALAPELNSPR